MKTFAGKTNRAVILLTAAILGSACGGGGGGSGDGTPPASFAVPSGGSFATVQTVVISADEPCMIHYSLDGQDPVPGAANTTSRSAPVGGIFLAADTVLKFFAMDPSGNAEPVHTEVYRIDMVPPAVTFVPSEVEAAGMLGFAHAVWQSDEDGTFTAELGGTSVQGTGVLLASGPVAAGDPMVLEVEGWRLSHMEASPLRVFVEDAVGRVGQSMAELTLKPVEYLTCPGRLVACHPAGSFVYAASGSVVTVLDGDPASPDFHQAIATVPLPIGSEATSMAVTPDGSRVYVTCQGTSLVAVLDTSTRTLVATIRTGPAPSGIAITPGGERAYFLDFSSRINVLGVDPASPQYHTVFSWIRRDLLLTGTTSISPDGRFAAVNWSGLIAHAIDVIDIDPSSPTYHRIIASPVGVVSDLDGGVVFAPDGSSLYATDSKLRRIETGSWTVTDTLVMSGVPGSALALTPDGKTLLLGNPSTAGVLAVDADALEPLALVDFGGRLYWDLAVSKDATRLYGGEWGSGEAICIPLR